MFWRVIFFLYLIYILLITSVQTSDVAQGDVSALWLQIFGITFLIFGIVLSLVYFYALGWQKQLVSPVYNKFILKTGIVLTIVFTLFFAIQEYSFLHKDMIMFALREGMVPRNPDFQALLWITRFETVAYALIRIFMVFVPFYFGYYFYTKKINSFTPVKFSGRKIFASFLLLNTVPLLCMVTLAFIENYVNYNLFDNLSLICGLYLLLGVWGYAFNIKILSQNFWKITLPLFTVISFLPATLNSGSFQKLVQMPTFQNEPIMFITSALITISELYLIYRYACTNEIYRNEIN